MTAKNIYVAMYRALDCLYDEDPFEELGEFLSEANPYLFQDRHAADPAIQKEFDEFVRGDLNMADAYECVKQYLAKKTQFHDTFSDITLEEWTDLCNIVDQEEQ